MGRTAIKAQEAKARARAARLTLLVARTAQDERIEDAAAAALLAWQDRAVAQTQVEKAERAVAAALGLLGQEKVLVREMATLTGIGEPVCGRLLRLRVESQAGTQAAIAEVASAASGEVATPMPGPVSADEGRRVDAAG